MFLFWFFFLFFLLIFIENNIDGYRPADIISLLLTEDQGHRFRDFFSHQCQNFTLVFVSFLFIKIATRNRWYIVNVTTV